MNRPLLVAAFVALALAIAGDQEIPSTAIAQEVCIGDLDCDGMPDAYEEAHACLDKFTPDGDGDPDEDLLTSIQEHDFLTDPCERDTDDDGCSDAEELGPDPVAGGDRNPNNWWDFFDVVPAIPPSPAADRFVDLSDALLVLNHFGHGPNDDPMDDLLDRESDAPGHGSWRTLHASDLGVDLNDAMHTLQQYGHGCIVPG